jgi:hypothetical protein
MSKRYGKQRLTYERWLRDFLPIVQDPDGNWGGYAVENFRECWESVCLPALAERRLWSACIHDDCSPSLWCLCPGNHPVNRDAVILTRVPYPEAVESLIVLY